MVEFWFPSLLVLALGVAYAVLDAWWARRREGLERARRRERLASGPAAGVDAAVEPAPAPPRQATAGDRRAARADGPAAPVAGGDPAASNASAVPGSSPAAATPAAASPRPAATDLPA